MRKEILRDFLNVKVEQYNNPKFIESDPILIPHSFSKKEDIEIAGFLVSTIAWGQRKIIIKNGFQMMEIMDNSPHDFVLNHSPKELEKTASFKHRTFNGDDFSFFIKQLKRIYKEGGGLEQLFSSGVTEESDDCSGAIEHFRNDFFKNLKDEDSRIKKHVSSPQKGSASKRLVMFLRWMVRNDCTGVDFGIWKSICPSILSVPLDVHTGNVARKLHLITRLQNDWKTVREMDSCLRELDHEDPAKYDFALFGLGIFEKF